MREAAEAEVRIPRAAVQPLIDLAFLLGRIRRRRVEEEFKHLLGVMKRYRSHIASRAWPEEWSYEYAVGLDETYERFIARGRKTRLERLTAVCLTKNMTVAEGFTPSGFLWSFWAHSSLLGVGSGEGINMLRMDAASFSENLLDWRLLPYQTEFVASTSMRIVCCWGRQTGKTKTTAVKAIHFGFVNEGVTVLIVSTGLRQSTLLLKMASDLLESSPVALSGVKSLTQTSIELKNGSRILALPCSENRIRGYTAHLVVCDEAAFMPEEVILRVLFPMLSTTSGSLILLSTPWGRDHFFHRAYQNPEYSVFHVSSLDSPLISEEWLEEQKKELSEEAFRMEYLAEFTEPASCFFPQDLIRGCIDPELQLLPSLEVETPEGSYHGGADLGKLADYSALTVLHKTRGQINLVFLHEFPLGTPYTEVIGFIARAEKKFRFQGLYIDQTGVGEPVLDTLKGRGAPHAKGVTLTARAKEEVMTCLKLAMEQRRLRMPYLRRLFSQINEQQYAYAPSGHLSFSHPVGGHDDQLWSLALAVYASTKERRPSPPKAVSIGGYR